MILRELHILGFIIGGINCNDISYWAVMSYSYMIVNVGKTFHRKIVLLIDGENIIDRAYEQSGNFKVEKLKGNSCL